MARDSFLDLSLLIFDESGSATVSSFGFGFFLGRDALLARGGGETISKSASLISVHPEAFAKPPPPGPTPTTDIWPQSPAL